MIRRTVRAITRLALVGTLGIALPTLAGAQSNHDPIAARALFDDARGLAAKGQYEQACPKFEESQRLDPGMGTLFNWADCLEHTGKTASAWVRFLDVAGQAKAAGQSEREKIARERATVLESKLSRLAIDVRSTDAGLEVTRDGVAIGKVLWGTAFPVDPGSHVVTARAPSRKTWTTTVQVPAGANRQTVTVPALEPEPASSTPTAATTPVAPPAQPTSPTDNSGLSQSSTSDAGSPSGAGSAAATEDSSSRKTYLTLGLVAGGVGVAALITGGVFLGQTISKNNEAKSICAGEDTYCDEADRHGQLVDDAQKARTISTVSFVVGGVMAAGAIALIVAAPSSQRASAQERTWRLQPLVSTTGAGILVGGAW